jgi:thiamine monophosphate kinase
LADSLTLPITMIGRIAAGSGVQVVDGTGRRIELGATGYRHF